ncbi:hypothetical protein BLOT_007858 [Blomia tropicalis]|nr:hypothetical protein BLOT_007858 [Blomia tropicalis]
MVESATTNKNKQQNLQTSQIVSVDLTNNCYSSIVAIGLIFSQLTTIMIERNNKVDIVKNDGIRLGPLSGSHNNRPGSSFRTNSTSPPLVSRKFVGKTIETTINSTVLDNSGLDSTASGHSMLDSQRIKQMKPYFKYSSIISGAIDDFFEGHVCGKSRSGRSTIFFDRILLYFVYIFCCRNLLLAFVEDLEFRGWLGETERARPQRQMVMIFTIWSIFISIVFRHYSRAMNTKYKLSWLEPFDVLRGEQTPHSSGLSLEMTHSWYNFTLYMWRLYFLCSHGATLMVTVFFMGVVRHRWNSFDGSSSEKMWFNVMSCIWAIINVAWTYIASTHAYVSFVYFNSLCYYFRIRFDKVNQDIETIITQRLKANERVAMLHHILVEHNSLCLKVSEYNRFWARYLMSAYFFLIAVICFTMFQAFFTTNFVYIRLIMLIFALISGFFITRISVSAAIMSNMAHVPYRRLIRLSFEKYPVELQIQLRMLIQRTSGPTIGFYCLDVFEITYTTYASILAALGQNFLLIVDFVRSYAEVGKDYSELDISDLNFLTESMFNSTLDVIDEMTGTHISEQLKNTSLLMNMVNT